MNLIKQLARLGCAAAVALVLLSACSSTPDPVALPAVVATETAEYRIGPGDALQIYVWNHPDLNVSVPVRPDGVISTPLVDNVKAEGKTAGQLAKDLEVALGEYVRAPKVNVIVTGFVGALTDQVRVVGQAAQPKALPFRAGMTLLDVMIAVGGLGDFAAGNKASLIRVQDGVQNSIPVRLNDLINKGDISANIAVQPGDILIIPESRF